MADSWIINRAKNSCNKYEAESWMLVAKTLGNAPDLSLAAFEINCTRRNAADAADCLQKLYMSAANDRFWQEVSSIVSVFRERTISEESQFKKSVFESLHKDMQQSLLLDMADRCTNSMDKTFLHLLLLSLFPDSALAYGIELLTTLKAGLKDCDVTGLANNLHAQLLVTEALPALLKCPNLPIPEDMCLGLLRDVLLILLSTVSAPKPRPPLLAEISPDMSQRMEYWRENPWNDVNGSILKLFKLFITKNDWKIGNHLTDPKFDSPSSYAAGLPVNDPNLDQNFFCALFALIRSADTYYRRLEKLAKECKWSDSIGHVLLAFVPSEVTSQPPNKKPKIENKYFQASREVVSSLIECLTTGVQCLKKVQEAADSCIRDPDAFLACDWLLKFVSDCMALDRNQNTLTDMINARIAIGNINGMNSDEQAYWNLRLFLCLRESNPKLAVSAVTQCVQACNERPKQVTTRQAIVEISIEDNGTLCLLPISLSLDLSVEYLLALFTPKLFDVSPPNPVLGTALVLSQVNHKKWSSVIKKSMEHIEKHGLEFPQFCKYVTSIDILEEMAYVHQKALNNNNKLRFIITPDAETSRKNSQNTRHSSKGVKEEIRSGLHKQASISHPPVHTTVAQYFSNEHNTLMLCFSDSST